MSLPLPFKRAALPFPCSWQPSASCSFSCLRKRDGSWWGWGLNNFGQLGIGSTTATPEPARIGTATNWVKLRAGGVSTAAIDSDGGLWIWGGSPELGNTKPRDPANLLEPVRWAPEVRWTDVSVAFNLWMGIHSDGSLWVWGRNAHLFSATDNERPVDALRRVGLDQDWQACASSGRGFHHLLRKRDGTFWILEGRTGSPPTPPRRVAWPGEPGSFDFNGGAATVVSLHGEVFTCGVVLGKPSARHLALRRVGSWLEAMGWNIPWNNPRAPVVRSEPWKMRISSAE